jgi:hypothetical protein
MASDEDYIAFLEKANQDPGAGVKSAGAGAGAKGRGVQLKTVDHGVEVPHELKIPTEKEEWVYISDADEPFVPVALKIEEDELPDEGLLTSPLPSPALHLCFLILRGEPAIMSIFAMAR